MSKKFIVTAKERPDLIEKVGEQFSYSWPEFIMHNTCSEYSFEIYNRFPDYQVFLIDEEDQILGSGNSVPLEWKNDYNDLPDLGWNWAMLKAFADKGAEKEPNLQCALAVTIPPINRGKGLSPEIIMGLKSCGKKHNLEAFIVPVRPNHKHKYPLIPMNDYIEWKCEDGSIFDPWMRVHQRVGGQIIKVCHQSLQVEATITQWEDMTKNKFYTSGEYIVPEALTPVKVSKENNKGIYSEPNVWMVHSL